MVVEPIDGLSALKTAFDLAKGLKDIKMLRLGTLRS
jgi:hypothetical protein